MSAKQIIIDNADRSARSFPGISSSVNSNPSRFILTLPPAPSVPMNVSHAAPAFAGPLATSNDVETQIVLYWQNLISDLQNTTQESHSGNPYDAGTDLPLARIKKIMKLDDDVRTLMISQEVPILFAKAAEYFISELTMRAWRLTDVGKRRTLQRVDIAQATSTNEQFDFLIDIVPRDELLVKSTRRASNPTGAPALGAAVGLSSTSACSRGPSSASSGDAVLVRQLGSNPSGAAASALSLPRSLFTHVHPNLNSNLSHVQTQAHDAAEPGAGTGAGEAGVGAGGGAAGNTIAIPLQLPANLLASFGGLAGAGGASALASGSVSGAEAGASQTVQCLLQLPSNLFTAQASQQPQPQHSQLGAPAASIQIGGKAVAVAGGASPSSQFPTITIPAASALTAIAGAGVGAPAVKAARARSSKQQRRAQAAMEESDEADDDSVGASAALLVIGGGTRAAGGVGGGSRSRGRPPGRGRSRSSAAAAPAQPSSIALFDKPFTAHEEGASLSGLLPLVTLPPPSPKCGGGRGRKRKSLIVS